MNNLTASLRLLIAAFFVLGLFRSTLADGLGDNDPANVRRVPKLGIDVSREDRRELEQGLSKLQMVITQLREKKDPLTDRLLPDVEIYHRAVSTALRHGEFFAPAEVETAKTLLATGMERGTQLLNGKAPWTMRAGLVVRGFRSRIDHSVQPYGLVIPRTYSFRGEKKHRLDLWFHGRGETLSEVKFIDQRSRDAGQFQPEDAFVLHPYGRYSNAFKLVGEVDVLEALEHAQQNYRIDPDRIASRGFSMGGAGAWQFAVHYPSRWFAANPGAGFSETPEFLKFFQKETLTPTWYERKLWHMYDCTDYAVNLTHCPTVAYSGELDIQKQAADIMEAALKKEGMNLVHIIGPETGHAYHPDAKIEVESRLAKLATQGRERMPLEIHFVTYTLKYNEISWITIDGLEEHWSRARIDAAIGDSNRLKVTTKNISDLTFNMPAGLCPFESGKPVKISIDYQQITAPSPLADRSWGCSLFRENGQWKLGQRQTEGLRKLHDLQGPIDDAFMDSFIFVRPTGRGRFPAVDKWVQSEFGHAVEHWRRQFRGDARIKLDTSIDDQDIANANLILWGDPSSNAYLAKIADKLPIRWPTKDIIVGDRRFASMNHVPLMIFPNPLNPKRYVVLNSSFTYREYDYLNNARQVPKLPDWAIIDIRTPADSRLPGKVVDADFFDERWQLRPAR